MIYRIIAILLLISSVVLAQNTESFDEKYSDYHETWDKDTIVAETNTYMNIIDLFNRDVFRFYYREMKQYDTDLKKHVFKKTDEYKYLKSHVDKLASDIYSKYFLLKEEAWKTLNWAFWDWVYSYKILSDYNINTKAFYITVKYNNEPSYAWWYNKYRFPTIPLSQKSFEVKKVVHSLYKLSIPDESIALEIENNKSDIELIVVFRVTNKLVQKKYITCKNPTVIVKNQTTDKIYFKKTY